MIRRQCVILEYVIDSDFLHIFRTMDIRTVILGTYNK